MDVMSPRQGKRSVQKHLFADGLVCLFLMDGLNGWGWLSGIAWAAGQRPVGSAGVLAPALSKDRHWEMTPGSPRRLRAEPGGAGAKRRKETARGPLPTSSGALSPGPSWT